MPRDDTLKLVCAMADVYRCVELSKCREDVLMNWRFVVYLILFCCYN